MVRFPGFLGGQHERSHAKERERHMSMKGWHEKSGDIKQSFADIRHMPAGVGRHLVRSEIARGRGQSKFKG